MSRGERKRIWVWLLAAAVLAGPPEGISIVSHRGFKAIAPENSIAAFEAAARAGADYVELDVRPTRDGVLILMHDARVDRTTNGMGLVSEYLFTGLRKLDAGEGQPVLTFREALEWGRRRGVRIDVDHKDGPVDEVARVIREAGMVERVVIEGPRDRLRQFAALLPGVDTMPKVTSVEDARAVCAALRTRVVRLSLAQLAGAGYVQAVRGCGARVSVTVLGAQDTEEGIRRVVGLGAELIETDQPDVAARVRGGKKPQ